MKISKVKTLTIYAVIYRYPDAERKPLTVAKARAAIKNAEIKKGSSMMTEPFLF